MISNYGRCSVLYTVSAHARAEIRRSRRRALRLARELGAAPA